MESLSPLEIGVTMVIPGFSLAILLRVGVLAHRVMLIVAQSLTVLPLTLDADAWYFGRSLSFCCWLPESPYTAFWWPWAPGIRIADASTRKRLNA